MDNNSSFSIMKKVVINILKFILALAIFILLYVIVAFLLSKITVSAEPNEKDEIEIYILTNGVHVDLVLPSVYQKHNWFKKIKHWDNTLDTLEYKYLAIGWGDKGFYLNTPSWAELKASTALKATCGLSGAAIHATYYKDMKESEICKRISLSNGQYERLVQYIHRSLKKDKSDLYIQIKTDANKSERDAFYEATGRYSIFNTCNSWANRGLKVAGQKACLWTAFQNGIFSKY